MSLSRVSVAVAAAAVVLVSCTSNSADSTVETPGLSGDIVFWDSTPLAASETVANLLDNFTSENPDVRVDYTNFRADEILTKFVEAVQARNPPDLVRLPTDTISGLAAGGALQSLDLTDLGLSPEDFASAAWSGGEFDGQMYAMPQTAAAPMVIFDSGNSDGVTAETLDRIDRMGALSKPVLAGGFSTETVLPFVYSAGGRMLDESKNQILIAADPAVRGFENGLSLIESGSLATYAQEPEPIVAARQAFQSGDVAALLAGWSEFEAVANEKLELPGDWVVLPPPAGAAGDRGTPYQGFHLAVPSAGQSDAADDLAVALTTAQAQLSLAQVGLFPTRPDVYDEDALSERPTIQQYRAVLESAVAGPTVDRAFDLYPPIYPEWRNMESGVTTARNGAVLISETWAPLLPESFTTVLGNPSP